MSTVTPEASRPLPERAADIDSLLERAGRLAARYFEEVEDRDAPVARALPPEELAQRLQLEIPAEGRSLDELLRDAESVLQYSVKTGHPRFFNQLFGGHDPAAVLGEWLTALVNTSMYTYEAAPVATLMERALIERMNRLVGFADGEGVFAPGGSISNLMAVIAARHRAFPHARQHGLQADDRPVMFLSEEAHYSLRRAANVIGIGLDGAVDIATDELGRMLPSALEHAILQAKDEGRRPFLVAATAGTTVPGAFDPIEAISHLTERHRMWLHVDASYGGTVLFSRAHRQLMEGVSQADSVAWNPHKMMGVPLACAALLLREKGTLAATNGMNADYLFHGNDNASWDTGDMTLQCGRRVDALKLWFSWQALGDTGYEQRTDRLFELAGWFREAIVDRPGFHLVREPQAANVCFRYLPDTLPPANSAERTALEHETTVRIREQLLAGGRFMINYATLDGAAAFRIVLSNPATTEADLAALLDEIEAIGSVQ